MQKMNIFRRIFALLLVTCTAMTYMPGYTFAAEDKAPDPVVTVFDVTGSGDGNAVTVTDGDGEETTVKSDAKVKGDDLTVDFEVSDGSAMKITVKNAEIKKANGLKNEGNAFTADQSKGSFTVIPEEGAQVSVEFTEQEPAEEAPKAEAENDGSKGDKETASDDDEESDPGKATEAEEKTEESKTEPSAEEVPAVKEPAEQENSATKQNAPKEITAKKGSAAAKSDAAILAASSKATGSYSDGDTVSYTTKEDSSNAIIFNVGGNRGYCCQAGKSNAAKGSGKVDMQSSSDTVTKVLYYIYKKGWDDKTGINADAGLAYQLVCQGMVQYAVQGKTAEDYWKTNAGGNWPSVTCNAIKGFVSDAKDLTVPKDFKVFILKDSDHQNGAVFYFAEPGKAKVQKASSNPNSPYSLAGAVYRIYEDSSCSTRAKDTDGEKIEFTTKADGSTNTAEIDAGTYYVKEISAPTGYQLDTTVHKCVVTEGKTTTVASTEPVTSYSVAVQKTAANTDTNFRSAAPNNYTLSGAVYGLYTSPDGSGSSRVKDVNGNNVTFTTKADGTTTPVQIWNTGTYYAIELTASKGFKRNTDAAKVIVTASNTASNPAKVTSVEEPVYGEFNISLVKQYKNGELGYSRLLGAEYTLSYYDIDFGYEDANPGEPTEATVTGKTPVKQWVFKAREGEITEGIKVAMIDFANDTPISGGELYKVDGKGVLPRGIFTIQETKAPRGIGIDKTVYVGKVQQVKVGGDAKASINGKEMLKPIIVNDRMDLLHEEPEKSVKLILNKIDKKTGKPIAAGSDRENIKGSLAGAVYEVYKDDPAAGYEEPVKVGEIVTDENGHGELTTDAHREGKDLTPGRYYIKEKTASPGYALDSIGAENVSGKYENGMHIVRAVASLEDNNVDEFEITSEEPPHETHVSKTDIATGEELPGAKLQVLDSTGKLVEEWTSTTEPHDIVGLHDETQGELKDGTYTLREITAPYGYDTAEDVEFKVTSGQIENTVEMKNAPIKIRTTATDVETGTHMGTFSSEEKIKDVVKFENLYAGRTYTFRGTLMDKKTGEALVGSDGQPITAEKEYTPSGEAGTLVSGEVELEFTVDASEFTKEKSVVAFEYIDREGRELQMHADLEDEDQTIRYGGIAATTAVDPESKSHNVLAAENTTIADTVEYSNLAVGETFILKGELFDQTTGELTGITAEKTFKAETSEGTIDVEFTFDASEMKNHTLVAFEKLYVIGKDEEGNDKEVELDKHEDPEDEAQTVHIPEVRTHAVDSETEEHISMADDEVVIRDRVTYSNVIPGKEYTIQGKLVFKDTGNDVIVDGQVVTAEKTFTAEKADGEEIIEFKFKGLDLAGKKVVAFEDFLEEKRPIAIHADLNDEEQTVNLPKIRTTALDSKTQDHVASADEVITIVDTVKYENLLPGKSYTMKGTLMSKTTGQPIQMNGANVTAEKVFTADKENGEVKLEFKVSSSAYKGDSTVAFEECYFNSKIVAIHKDLNDKEQTVDIPSIGTNATDSDTGDHIANGDEKVTIVDRVEYKNLTPGKEYIVVGILVDKNTGKTVTVDGEKLQEQTTFTPSSPNGSVNVTFKFDGTDLRGHKLVAFEYLYYKNVLVATHANINDEDQSVTIPKIATKVGRKSGSYVIDTVEYKGLIPGKEYVMKGYFVTKSDGNRVSGSDGEYTFVPDSPNGKVEVKLDPRNVRSAMVAFESCYLVTDDDEEKLVGEHKDLSDEDQTYRPTPKTGDNSNFILFGGVFLLSAALYLIMRLRRRAAAVRK